MFRNPDLKKQLWDISKSQILDGDTDPNRIVQNIQPVLEMSQKYSTFHAKSSSSTSGTSMTIFTAPTDRDVYLTSASYSFMKDATCDTATASDCGLSASLNGNVISLIADSIITLTAQKTNITVSFPHPIKIDRGTAVLCATGTFTVGLRVAKASVTYITI